MRPLDGMDLKRIEQREWQLWVLAFILISALTAIISVNYILVGPGHAENSFDSRLGADTAMAALVFVVIFFGIYIFRERSTFGKLKGLIEENRESALLWKERMEGVLTSVPVGMLILSSDMRIVSSNLRFREMLGQKDMELRGKRLEEVFEVNGIVGKIPGVPDQPGACGDAEAELFVAGEKRFFQITVSEIKNSERETGRCMLILVDITERKRAEDALRKAYKDLQETQASLLQSEKMASIGQLAAGVAHEINNPVGYILSNLGTLKEYVEGIKKVHHHYEALTSAVEKDDRPSQTGIVADIVKVRRDEDLDYILEDVGALVSQSTEGAQRVKEIVHNLKCFARVDEAEIKEADINEGLEATLKLIWNELKYKCQINKKLGAIPKIRCYPGQLNQVFMNLLVNAAQAIPHRGEIDIETWASGGRVFVKISDTGAGIKKEHIHRLFTPFFTTKPVGKGTGLGLSISYGIIKKHNGTIEVRSEENKGTSFTIALPLDGIDGVKEQ